MVDVNRDQVWRHSRMLAVEAEAVLAQEAQSRAGVVSPMCTLTVFPGRQHEL